MIIHKPLRVNSRIYNNTSPEAFNKRALPYDKLDVLEYIEIELNESVRLEVGEIILWFGRGQD
ncbi:hypothetical protein GCM10027275_27010 [Rhabdobacter roseus]